MELNLSTTETPVIEKTKELCRFIVDQPQFSKMLADMDQFMNDDKARTLYEQVTGLQEGLVAKQQRGEALTDEEIEHFEEQRDILLENRLACGYIEARQQIVKVQDSINRYVQMTFELGRVPLPEEVEQAAGGGGGCCGGGGGGGGGGGCGCH